MCADQAQGAGYDKRSLRASGGPSALRVDCKSSHRSVQYARRRPDNLNSVDNGGSGAVPRLGIGIGFTTRRHAINAYRYRRNRPTGHFAVVIGRHESATRSQSPICTARNRRQRSASPWSISASLSR